MLFAVPVWAGSMRLNVPIDSSGIGIAVGARGTAVFSCADAQRLSVTGEPDIPWRVISILLPPDAILATVTASAEDMIGETLQGQWAIRPVGPSATRMDGELFVEWPTDRTILDGKDTAIYGRAGFWPETDVRLLGTGHLRKWRLAQVAVPLVKYDPVRQMLYRVNGGRVVVEFERSAPLKAVAARRRPAEVTDRIGEDRVRRLAVNYTEVGGEYDSAGVQAAGDVQAMVNPAVTPRYVIITTSAIQTASTKLAAFVTHKQAQGFDVSVITESQFGGGTGDTAANNIRNWLINHYVTDNIEYVLLIGDPRPTTGAVPMKMLYPRGTGADATAPSDIFYADLTGNWNLDGDAYYGEYSGDRGTGGIDRFWEVMVGRIPYYGTIADLDNILQKIMDYQNQPAASVAWRRSALLPMRDPDDWTAAHELGEGIKTDTLTPNNWSYHRVYQDDTYLNPPPETTPCTKANVTNVWKAGSFGLVLWWTHGSDTSATDVMDTTYAAQLGNTYPSLTFQCSCNNGYPETTTNLCYTLLKKGAVCTVGDTRVSWYEQGQDVFKGSTSNAGMGYEYASRVVLDNATFARALYDVTMVLTPESDKKWMNFVVFNIYGDPSTTMVPRCGRRYVNAAAAPGGEGTSWPNAYTDLQAALDEHATEIWVAAGTYKPDRGTGSRAASFRLRYNTAIYGGFAGGETSLSQRSPATNVTILSGDLAGNDGPDFANNSENSYNVVTSRGCDARSVLDGLTIKGGYASNSSTGGGIQDRGAGLHNCAGSNPSINNCIFTGNRSSYQGGALHNASRAASPTVTSCTFIGNSCTGGSGGGAVANTSGSLARYTSCLFTGNSCANGGAIKGESDSAGFINCDFIANTATTSGGAVQGSASTATFINCRFLGNAANNQGGAFHCDSSSPTAVNCVFSGNTAAGGGGGAIFSSWTGTLRLTNCTIVGNAATGTNSNGGGLNAYSTTSMINNCVFWNNRDKTGYSESGQIYKYSGTMTVSYSCVQYWSGALGGSGNIGVDPLLADPDGADNVVGTTDDDVHVLPGSSALDSGNNAAVPVDTFDIDGDGNTTELLPIDLENRPRFVNDPGTDDTGSGTPPIVDMGVYEGPCQGFVLSARVLSIAEAGNSTLTVALSQDPGQPVLVSVYRESGDGDIDVLSGGSFTLDSSNYATPHTVTLHANADADNLAGTATIIIAASGIYPARVAVTEQDDDPVADVLYVDADATGGNNGATWTDAYTDLQTALSMANVHLNVTEIRVAQGTYKPAGSSGGRASTFQMRSGLALRGSYAGVGQPNPEARSTSLCASVLSGDLAGNDTPGFGGNSENCYHVVTATGTDATAVLDGFTVTGGNANGTSPLSLGGGIYAGNGSPTIVNCTFRANAAGSGAGLYRDQGDPLSLSGCDFVGNAASANGGGLYCSNIDAAIIGCRFMGNASTASGGGLYLSGGDTALLANCLFSGNTSASGGGIYENAYGAVVTNCTFSRNSASGGGGGFQSYSGATAFANCVFWRNSRNGSFDEYAQLDWPYEINYCCVEGWTGDMGEGFVGNHGNNPLFVDDNGPDNIVGTIDDDLRLGAGSPCIDAGDNDAIPSGVTTDLSGAPRRKDDAATANGGNGDPPIVDMGAYEFFVRASADFDFDGDVDGGDFNHLEGCSLGPDVAQNSSACANANLDGDADVDMDDFAVFQRCYSGAGHAAAAGCGS